MAVIDKMKEAGEDAGLIRLRLWRPFPFEELRKAVTEAETITFKNGQERARTGKNGQGRANTGGPIRLREFTQTAA